jgi:hypothetical protein
LNSRALFSTEILILVPGNPGCRNRVHTLISSSFEDIQFLCQQNLRSSLDPTMSRLSKSMRIFVCTALNSPPTTRTTCPKRETKVRKNCRYRRRDETTLSANEIRHFDYLRNPCDKRACQHSLLVMVVSMIGMRLGVGGSPRLFLRQVGSVRGQKGTCESTCYVWKMPDLNSQYRRLKTVHLDSTPQTVHSHCEFCS